MDRQIPYEDSRDPRSRENTSNQTGLSNPVAGIGLKNKSAPPKILQPKAYNGSGNYGSLTRTSSSKKDQESNRMDQASRMRPRSTNPDSFWKDVPDSSYSSSVSTDSSSRKYSSLQRTSDSRQQYIKPELVKGILDFQKNQRRSVTPVLKLSEFSEANAKPTRRRNSDEEENLVIGRRDQRSRATTPLTGRKCFSNSSPVEGDCYPGHLRLTDSMASLKLGDPETVSIGSQKESGYHSGDTDSVVDYPSNTCMSTLPSRSSILSSSSLPLNASPDEKCEHYFLKGENFLETFDELEQQAKVVDAKNCINLAIDCFERALSITEASIEGVLRIRTKYNTALLRRRRFLKQHNLASLPRPESDNNMIPRRRLPQVPPVSQSEEDRSRKVNGGVSSPMRENPSSCRRSLTTPDITHDRFYRPGEIRKYEFRETAKEPTNETVRSSPYCENNLSGVEQSQDFSSRQVWSREDAKNADIYGTLPKLSPKYATRPSSNSRSTPGVEQLGGVVHPGYPTKSQRSSNMSYLTQHDGSQYNQRYSHPFDGAEHRDISYSGDQNRHSLQRVDRNDNSLKRADHNIYSRQSFTTSLQSSPSYGTDASSSPSNGHPMMTRGTAALKLQISPQQVARLAPPLNVLFASCHCPRNSQSSAREPQKDLRISRSI